MSSIIRGRVTPTDDECKALASVLGVTVAEAFPDLYAAEERRDRQRRTAAADASR